MTALRFCGSSGTSSENKRKQNERQILNSCERAEDVEYEVDDDISCSWCTWNGFQRLKKKKKKKKKKVKDIGNQRKNKDDTDHSLVEINSNT